ncbi:polar amino acid transport system permease protein [Rhizobium mongolense subsp. loessense]|uniref:Polar amino acid transport system permease protein n=1 Tax=Rhizobium mongolense subsp. loessense TaxID=158890 RepID=A0A1G4SC94_9HYPH|nr:amino acid ABC transporter permease [Rhizobium mongolense]SCW66648.1 polar amino acid transport system permease protein [Rhizobium mongolense subsp. loessense]
MDDDLVFRIVAALGSGVIVTLEVTAGALVLAVGLGLALAAIRHLWPRRAIDLAISSYVEFLRNIPSLTLLFLLYFGLAAIGMRLPALTAAIVGLGLIGAAVVVDIFRAGFQAVPQGQREAAAAIGLTPIQAFRLVILPQGLRIAFAPLGNYAVSLVKDTSLVAAIAAPEVMFNARQLVNETFQTTLVYGCAALLYLVITYSLGQAVRWVEHRTAY